MKTFNGKTAVITGAGSGIGRGLAIEAARRDMNVVLADINEADLSTVSNELEAESASILPVLTDVSNVSAMEHLANMAHNQFGRVHLLANNAGVSSAPKPVWESSLKDWEWVMGVNLMSVIYGVKTFVPEMIEHGEEAHIVNTASIAGLIANSRLNTYGVTKHAVVALSETLALDLEEVQANISVSVLCPAWIKTQIHKSERNRPDEFKEENSRFDNQAVSMLMQAVENGMEVEDVIKEVFYAIENQDFYILTHPPFDKLVRQRMDGILNRAAPQSTW